jgi:hypothetical protein
MGTWLIAIAAALIVGAVSVWLLDDVLAGVGAGAATLVVLKLLERVGMAGRRDGR